MSDVMLIGSGSGSPELIPTGADIRLIRPVVEFISAINRGDIDGAVARLAPDALHHGRVSNYRPEGVRVLFGMLRTILPDLRLDISEIRTEGNRVITRVVASGTHTGSYMGKPPTGRPVVWDSVDIAEVDIVEVGVVDDGEDDFTRIKKRFWDLMSDPKLWKEIGVIPAIMC